MLLPLSEHADLSRATLSERHADALCPLPWGAPWKHPPLHLSWLTTMPLAQSWRGDYGLLMLHVPGYSDNHSGSSDSDRRILCLLPRIKFTFLVQSTSQSNLILSATQRKAVMN